MSILLYLLSMKYHYIKDNIGIWVQGVGGVTITMFIPTIHQMETWMRLCGGGLGLLLAIMAVIHLRQKMRYERIKHERQMIEIDRKQHNEVDY